MKVFLDDCRETPEGWYRVFTVEETINALNSKLVTHLSLDNDLGDGFKEGYKVLDWFEEVVYNSKDFPIPIITVHSSNAARVDYMNRAIENINKIRKQQLEREQSNEG